MERKDIACINIGFIVITIVFLLGMRALMIGDSPWCETYDDCTDHCIQKCDENPYWTGELKKRCAHFTLMYANICKCECNTESWEKIG